MKSKILIPSLIATSLALAAVVSVPTGVSATNLGVSANVSVQPPKGFGPDSKKGPMVNDGERGRMMGATSTRPMTGKPAVVGKVTAVSGTTLTIDSFRRSATSSATTTFMVDASKAVVRKGSATSTVSAVTTGDLVLVQGTITGTSITASLVIDGVRPAQNAPRGDMKGNGASMEGNAGVKVGFFGGIKNFFSHLFGF